MFEVKAVRDFRPGEKIVTGRGVAKKIERIDHNRAAGIAEIYVAGGAKPLRLKVDHQALVG